MNSDIDFAVAIDFVNRKIAEINMKIVENNSEDLQQELDKYLKIKEEIYDGNVDLIERIVKNEIQGYE